MAQFSDTTNKNGLIQKFEFWTRMPDGTVTDTLLKQVTDRINCAFEYIMPMLISYSDFIRWDDTNHPDRPIGTINLVSGQSDYTVSQDDNSLDILNITAVRILPTATATEYVTLEKMTLDDPRVLDAMSPNSSITGIPTAYVENDNNIFFYPKPNYSATNGIKLFFSREQSYFVSTDTTKKPGIPKPFHELLVLYAALDWSMVNRANDASLLTLIREKITELKTNLNSFISLRNPTRLIMTTKTIKHR